MSMEKMLYRQLRLQVEHMTDGDPRELEGPARAEFMRWNAFALEDELHEAFQEVKWKPWATGQGDVDHEAFMREMVDAWHFFMNLLIAGSGVESMSELADWFQELYYTKNAKNAQRQVEGYDGVTGKCPNCKRELSEVAHTSHVVSAETNLEYCTTECLFAKEHN